MSAPATSGTGTALATSVEHLLDAMDRLPSQGNIALRVLWMADDPTTTLSHLARAVESDPVLVARLLHLANSAYYSPRNPIANAERAITLLGFATVRTLATIVACGLGSAAPVPQGFWQHGASVANAAQLIAWRFGVPTGDAFTLGLLHDLGRGLLHVADPGRAAAIDLALEQAARSTLPAPGRVAGYIGRPAPAAPLGRSPEDEGLDAADPRIVDAPAQDAHPLADRLELEQAAFGITHAGAAARVLQSWRFPAAMVEAIAHHHDHHEVAASDMTRLLIAAEAVAELAVGPWGEPVAVEAGVSLLGIEAERLDSIITRVRTESGTLASVLGR
jgi:HD-like signal output (HDOD) protein